jgi:hypothetical protein
MVGAAAVLGGITRMTGNKSTFFPIQFPSIKTKLLFFFYDSCFGGHHV